MPVTKNNIQWFESGAVYPGSHSKITSLCQIGAVDTWSTFTKLNIL